MHLIMENDHYGFTFPSIVQSPTGGLFAHV